LFFCREERKGTQSFLYYHAWSGVFREYFSSMWPCLRNSFRLVSEMKKLLLFFAYLAYFAFFAAKRPARKLHEDT